MEVNQRALIDKVLARYSGEFTVFRELLQNSDDAQATAVEIRFETKIFLDRKQGLYTENAPQEQSLPDLKSAAVCFSVYLGVKSWVRSFPGSSMEFYEQRDCL